MKFLNENISKQIVQRLSRRLARAGRELDACASSAQVQRLARF